MGMKIVIETGFIQSDFEQVGPGHVFESNATSTLWITNYISNFCSRQINILNLWSTERAEWPTKCCLMHLTLLPHKERVHVNEQCERRYERGRNFPNVHPSCLDG